MGAAGKRETGCCPPARLIARGFFHLSIRWPFPCTSVLSLQIEGALDSARLAAALEQVRNRHAALRVCIVDDGESGAGVLSQRTTRLISIRLRLKQPKTGAGWLKGN